MASLRRLARDQKIEEITGANEIRSRIIQYARDHDCIGINARQVADTVMASAFEHDTNDKLKFSQLPCTPPFEKLWIEFEIAGHYHAAIVRRREQHLAMSDQPEDLSMWHIEVIAMIKQGDAPGIWLIPITEHIWLDKAGVPRIETPAFPPGLRDEMYREDNRIFLTAHAVTVLVIGQTLARLNCKNVRLVSGDSNIDATHPRKRRKVNPSSVWHDIIVSAAPVRAAKTTITDECADIRARWIRGHYADYRNGPGLFGNPKLKCVFWYPEHRVGKEELGEIVPTYIT